MSDIFNNIQVPYATTQQNNTSALQSTTSAAQKTQSTEPLSVKEALPASPTGNSESDTVELSKTKSNKQGPVKAVKGFISNIKKFFASTGEYVKGTAKGVATGAVAGSLIYTGGNIINHFKSKAAEKAGTAAKKLPNKALAVVAAGISVAAGLWNASLNATERKSNIDLRWKGLNNNNEK